jgi:hypothetical protein
MASMSGAPKPKKPLPAPNTKLTKHDYLYAYEVSVQPAKTAAEKKFKRQAKADVLYLEQKFPKYTASIRNPQTRYQRPEFGGAGAPKAGKTRAGKMSSSRSTMRAE